ncbi:MAG: polyprenyl synthetase family protein [Nanoarchaeota archaeon]
MDFYTNKYRDRIENELRKFLPEHLSEQWVQEVLGTAKGHHEINSLDKTVSEPVWNFLKRGGKRWRPVLMLLCCETVGGKAEEILQFTVVPELIHNGTLIVDDIEDNSDLRRGQPVLHKLFGIDVAVNAGNALYILPFAAIRNSSLPAETKAKAYEIITTQLIKCHLGQASDIYWHSGKSDKVPSEQEYIQMCTNKTGSLASMAAQLGALLGGGSNEQISALAKFAETAGVVFQIQDDILNIALHENIGKEFGDDIKEGKRTLLVIHALNAASEAEKTRLLEILNMHTKDEKLLKEAIDIINKHNSIPYTKKTATRLVEETWKETEGAFPESEAKNQLRELAQMLIHRSV